MLSYSEHGDADGIPLLIAHGLYGSGRNWGVIAKRLADTRRVITVDMRNHGHSFWSDAHGYDDLAADLAEVIDTLGGPMDVVGHSMGGKAAMMLALSRPETVHRLVVGDIAPVSYGHSQMQYIEAMRAVDLSSVTRRSDANAQLAAQGIEPALCSFLTQSLDVTEQRWRLNIDALAANMPAILGFPEVSGHFDGPTLFLSGGQSDYVTAERRPTIRALFPAARFVKIPGAGHWLHADDPRAFEGTVRAYLDAPGA
ncbi:alpha/beta fold hydrolase [Tateyamaria omphalii]|uniref:alpha/beta fold hydrolase n=1 Tax=Tateyamaria omphalii TaxID=299262 RepID=UPI001C99F5D9|nr:alpha/beta fold hydrolase [Tateyamaria omphalii]MBY5934160.1 alpha/beta fold hydrolase [Tateyamaria omphalii]